MCSNKLHAIYAVFRRPKDNVQLPTNQSPSFYPWTCMQVRGFAKNVLVLSELLFWKSWFFVPAEKRGLVAR